MREYIELMHDIARDESVHFSLYDTLEQPFLTLEVLQNAEATFDEAARLVAGQPEYSERVATARLSTEYVYLQRNTRYTISADKYHLPGEEVAERGQRFFEQAGAFDIKALREGGQSPQAEAAGVRDFDLVTLESEALKLTVAPQMGGRILSLMDLKTQQEWMHLPQPLELDYPFTGGYEEYSMAQWHSPGWRNEYSCEKNGDSILLRAELENGLELERSYVVNGSSLLLESKLTNRSGERQQVTLRSHPDFAAGDWSTLAVQTAQKTIFAPWKTSDAQRGSPWLENTEKPDGVWSLVRGESQLTIEFDESQVEKCLLDWNCDYNSICLELFTKTQWLEAGETTVLRQSWRLSKH